MLYLGYHQAMSMLLTGRTVSALEAKELGIVSQVVAGGNDEVSVAVAPRATVQSTEIGLGVLGLRSSIRCCEASFVVLS